MRRLDTFRETKRGIMRRMDSIASQCLLTNGTGLGRIFKGGNMAFKSGQGVYINLERIFVLSLNFEGQDGGKDCLEVAFLVPISFLRMLLRCSGCRMYMWSAGPCIAILAPAGKVSRAHWT